ncbi:MAG: NAD(P)H-dependent flavin oxidoreductase, partial [Acidimicrobiales bacterium]
RHLPPEVPLPALVEAVRADTGLPVVAAGGVATRDHVAAALGAGAMAVMVGTALLLSDESGASPAYRGALAGPSRGGTVVTRAFTGRPARGLPNAFTRQFGATAPLGYPAVHHLTRGLRRAAAAAGDPEHVNLWAGTGYRGARRGPAATILAGLAEGL